jgi:surface polysaccharide O-acyltransferase-like enzyme
LQPKPAGVNYPVDLIRTIAIVMVVLVHASEFPYRIPATISPMVMVNWFTADVYGAIGYLGVPLFVILSGALLLDPVKADESMSLFFRKRFVRVGLPLIFWTLIFFVWTFAIHQNPFTIFNIQQGLLSGSYPILWFLYMLIGLYLITPILRVLVKHIDRKKFTLLLALWFAGTVITPFIHTFTNFDFNPLMFVFTDWVGYFLLGIYLLNTKMRPAITYLAAGFGLLAAILGAWIVTATYGEQYTGYFHGYLSFNMIIASGALFLLLISIPQSRVESQGRRLNGIIKWIGQNTLPIYVIHIIVLESFQLGLLGFSLPYTGNLIVDAPINTIIVFGLSAAIIFPLKKIPYLKNFIG